MALFERWYGRILREKLKRPYVHILFGARQAGKSTLVKSLLPAGTLEINLADPGRRSRYLADPGELISECKSAPRTNKPHYVFIDEAQTVPAIFDAVQFLYDEDKTRWRFVLCGSSARKLRMTGANLLPGRSLIHHLYPLMLLERPAKEAADNRQPVDFPLRLVWSRLGPKEKFPMDSLLVRLAYGELPGVVTSPHKDRADILKSYATVHLEEEIRREALVKDWGGFVRFLRLAAAESGQILNYTSISQEAGVSQPTVKTYYQLLEDMFMGFSVPAYSKSPRKNLLSTPKFFFFDLGVRHAAAGFSPSTEAVMANPGSFFEQWVGIELWKRLRYSGEGSLFHQRSKDGAEVDFIVEHKHKLVPIEVKWTERPSLKDARHMLKFLQEKRGQAIHGYLICRCPRPLRLHENITALPWFCL